MKSKFKACLGFRVSSKPIWAPCETVSQKKKKKRTKVSCRFSPKGVGMRRIQNTV